MSYYIVEGPTTVGFMTRHWGKIVREGEFVICQDGEYLHGGKFGPISYTGHYYCTRRSAERALARLKYAHLEQTANPKEMLRLVGLELDSLTPEQRQWLADQCERHASYGPSWRERVQRRVVRELRLAWWPGRGVIEAALRGDDSVTAAYQYRYYCFNSETRRITVLECRDDLIRDLDDFRVSCPEDLVLSMERESNLYGVSDVLEVSVEQWRVRAE